MVYFIVFNKKAQINYIWALYNYVLFKTWKDI